MSGVPLGEAAAMVDQSIADGLAEALERLLACPVNPSEDEMREQMAAERSARAALDAYWEAEGETDASSA